MIKGTTPWLRTLAQLEDTRFDERADAQYAAVLATLRAQQRRRWALGGALALTATAAAVMVWAPSPASPREHNPAAAAAANYADPSTAAGVAHPSAEHPGAVVEPALHRALRSPTDQRSPKSSAQGPGKLEPVPRRDGHLAPGTPKRQLARAVPSWRAQLRSGQAAAALAEMDATSWSSFLELGTATELLAIAHAARARKSTARARGALLEIRKRFPRDDLAAQATFLLGRVEGDLASNEDASSRWFTRYVHEFPKGQFVEQARGRVLSDLIKRGAAADAKQAAKQYLKHHPGGAYASVAERCISARP